MGEGQQSAAGTACAVSGCLSLRADARCRAPGRRSAVFQAPKAYPSGAFCWKGACAMRGIRPRSSRWLVVAVFIVIVGLVAALVYLARDSASEIEAGLRPVTLFMSYVPSVQFAPV